VAPWLNLQCRVALARVALIRGDRVEARALLGEADAILTAAPGAGGVAGQLARLRPEITARDRTQSFGPSSLTTAELLVLQLLPTHLTATEIAVRLNVSPNTVRSQIASIYRKLDVSSRSDAITAAAAAGLVTTRRLEGPILWP